MLQGARTGRGAWPPPSSKNAVPLMEFVTPAMQTSVSWNSEAAGCTDITAMQPSKQRWPGETQVIPPPPRGGGLGLAAR